MINPVLKQEANGLRERLSIPMERIDVFPEPNDYCGWIEKVSAFIASRGGASAFGVERYRGDLEFFTADSREEYAIIFLTKLSPLELVFFGPDWIIGISSYPECEGSGNLEYAIRLYGIASIIETAMTRRSFGAT